MDIEIMSNDKHKVEPFYQKQAKEFVDMLHDNKLINLDFTRDDLQTVEDYVAYLLESGAQSAVRVALMLEKLKK